MKAFTAGCSMSLIMEGLHIYEQCTSSVELKGASAFLVLHVVLFLFRELHVCRECCRCFPPCVAKSLLVVCVIHIFGRWDLVRKTLQRMSWTR